MWWPSHHLHSLFQYIFAPSLPDFRAPHGRFRPLSCRLAFLPLSSMAGGGLDNVNDMMRAGEA